jgi:1,4-dihydroxy-2-naphthoate octaprenyltransferase
MAIHPGPRVWLMAARPKTLPASLSGVVAGLGAAAAVGAALRLDAALLCFAVALLLQVAANLANDLSDFRHGADRPDRAGPTRVAAAGLLTPRQLERAIAAVLGMAGLAGVGLTVIGGPVILLVGASAVLAALAYTGGPWPYGYHALGEPFVFVYFGLVAVVGTAYLQAGDVWALFVVTAVPVGSLVTAILVVNNLRDIEPDRSAGKRTVAVLVGPAVTRVELTVLIVLPYVVAVALALGRGWPLLLPLVTIPMVPRLLGSAWTEGEPARLNAVLAGTATLSVAFAVTLALGLALSAS